MNIFGVLSMLGGLALFLYGMNLPMPIRLSHLLI